MARRRTAPGLSYAVIDTTLLCRLVELDIADRLPLVFKQIRIPPEVKREAYKAPHKGKHRLQKLFRQSGGFFSDCTQVDEGTKLILMVDLDAGEAAAIAQADHTKSQLLIDEAKGHNRAIKMSIKVVRTGRLLCMLKENGAIPFIEPYLDRLERLGFRLSPEARLALLKEAGEVNG